MIPYDMQQWQCMEYYRNKKTCIGQIYVTVLEMQNKQHTFFILIYIFKKMLTWRYIFAAWYLCYIYDETIK